MNTAVAHKSTLSSTCRLNATRRVSMPMRRLPVRVACKASSKVAAAPATDAQAPAKKNGVEYWNVEKRMSRVLKHNGTVYTAGITSRAEGIAAQTAECLEKLEAQLAAAGTTPDRLLSVQIWLTDIEADFAAMNAVYDPWVEKCCEGLPPTRACVESKLASPALLVELRATAAAGDE